MKKIISMLLVITLCFSVLPFSAFAQNSVNEYTSDEKEFILMKYTNNEHMLDALFGSDTAIAYWSMVNDTEENGFLKWSIDKASQLIGEYPDKQDYAEILANLIMMQSGDIANQVQNQSQFDDLKDGVDYVMDVVKIAKSFIGGAELFETVSPIIDAATGGADVIIKNQEQAKYYETSIRDYSQTKLFLDAVAQYADNDELKDAAKSLLKANDTLLEKRLEYLADVAGSLAEYEAQFFVENMSFALLKTADLYASDETVKWYVDSGEKLANSIKSIFAAGEFAFRMTMLAGDIGFGTSDTFNRYQEMKIVSDVAGAIVEANSKIAVPQDADADSVLTDIQTKCSYYKMLISTHARGEYLVYQLLVNDAGLLSDFRVLFDYFKEPGETTDSWYAKQIDCMTDYYDILERMFEVSDADVPHGLYDDVDVPDNAVEFNGHYYYIYDFAGLSSDESNTWENALDYCEGVNGYLATITSQEENDFLFSYMKQEGYSSAYFGLTDISEEGQWEWCNGEVVDYTNWAPKEPSEATASNYGMFYYEYSDATWNDGNFDAASSISFNAEVNSVTATSTLTDSEYSYLPEMVMDGNLSTAWVEGSDGLGIGETLSFVFTDKHWITGFSVNTGYQKNTEIYERNSRPSKITLTYSTGISEDYTLEDICDIQYLELNQPILTESVVVTIDSAYAGSRWEDTAISELTFYAQHSNTAFICEWGEYEITPHTEIVEPTRTTSDERDIVLVLDVSGSMSGTPITETKKASANFIDTILDEDASIGIVTYDDSSNMLSDFSVDKNALTDAVSNIYDGGGTNIEAGLAEAHAMLNTSGAKKKIIVLMSDGEPNEGKEGDALIAYADEIKNDDIVIYTLGFFESLGSYKSSAQILMEGIASDGCHYEVANADDLVFFFEDMADQINGQKYIYIRIACPVDVSVTYNGETLSSAEDDLTTRTDFGTLTFEENENVTDADEDDRIKVLRLKEGADYDVEIVGTGHGIMDYTIGFMDENGDYSDFRRFEDIKITRRTKIDTVATVSKDSVLNIDEDGDGKYDLKLRADENGYGEEVDDSMMVYVAVGGGALLLLLIVVCVARKKRKNKKMEENN